MSGIGRETLLKVQEWKGVPPGCPGVVETPYRISASDREASCMSGSDLQALQHVR